MGLNGWVVGFGVAPQTGTTHVMFPRLHLLTAATASDEGWFNGMV
jgi:hypothetical protein